MVDQQESVDIFEDTDTVYDSATGETITKSDDVIRAEKRKAAKESAEKIIGNVGQLGTNVADWVVEEATVPLGIAIGVFNFGSSIVDGPEIPSPLHVNDFIQKLAKQEYDSSLPGLWKTGEIGTALVTGGFVYDKTLDKIKAAYPKLYQKLKVAFPYSVGQIHGMTTEALAGGAQVVKGKNKVKNLGNIVKNLAKRAWPTGPTRYAMGANMAKLVGSGMGLGMIANLMSAKPTGDGTIEGPINEVARTLLGADYTTIDYTGTQLEGILPTTYFNEAGTDSRTRDEIYEYLWPQQTQEEINATQEAIKAENERYDALPFNRKAGEYFSEWGEWLGETRPAKTGKKIAESSGLIGSMIRSFMEEKFGKEDSQEDEGYDMFSDTVEGQAEELGDLIENEQYLAERDKIGTLPTYEDLYSEEGKFPPLPANKMAYGGDPSEGGMFTDSIITGEEEDINIDDIIKQPGLENMSEFDIFEEAKKEGYKEYQVAGNLLGKVPMWAMANVDKAKMLMQIFTKNEKKNMDNIKNKLGTEEQVNKVEEIDIINTPSGGQAVGDVKIKKTIIDSPEANESVFYSGLEARLMDPNTPTHFANADEFFQFLQRQGVSKPEVEDNILNRYIDISNKNKVPLRTADMLKIVRQSPMRNIDSVTYGDARYGGEKSAKYPGYQESGAIPGSYREEVLFLDPKYIPNDPDQLPGSSHDFSERYVIGWSRLTDRKATLPVDKTKAGITEAIDEKQIRAIKRNQKKLASQVDGLYASAYQKLKRAGDIEDLPDIDNLTSREIKDTVNQFTFDLEALDAPLHKQIEQFENKLMTDTMKLNKFTQMKEGQKVIVTMADEIQSDILQQAKKLEDDLREQLGELLDMAPEKRMAALGEQITRYSGSAKQVNPEVLKFYTQNETIFRPMFQTAEDMQGFVEEFVKNKSVFDEIAKAGPAPSDDLIKRMNIAVKKEKKMLEDLEVALSEGAMKQLFPNVPFKTRSEWGEALVKRDLAKAAKLLYQDKIPDAGQWYAISPAHFIKKRYGQKGGTNTPLDQRTKDMKGIGTEEFYGGPDSLSTSLDKDGKPKHYTSVLEKILKRAAKENNSEFKTITVDGMGKVYAIKITPEMLLPHKTHRKDGGMVYTPEIIDIFEAA